MTFFSYTYSKASYSVVSEQLRAFIDLFKLAVTDYYKLDKVAEFFHNEQVFDDDNLANLITSIIFKDERVYETVFRAFVEKNRENQKLFCRYVESVEKLTPSDF